MGPKDFYWPQQRVPHGSHDGIFIPFPKDGTVAEREMMEINPKGFSQKAHCAGRKKK